MDTVDLAHAKAHLEELMARAARGEEVCISEPGLGTVRIMAVAKPAHGRPRRVIGQWKGRFVVPERLFEPLTDGELAEISGENSP